MVNQAGSSKRNQPRASTRKSYAVRNDSGSKNRSAKSSGKPKFNSNNAKSSTSSNSSSSSRYKKRSNDSARRSSFRKSSDSRLKPKDSLDSKSSESAARSDRYSRDRQIAGSRPSARKPFERNQTGERRTDATNRSDRSGSYRSYPDRSKPRSSSGRPDRAGLVKPRTNESKPAERGGSGLDNERARRDSTGKPRISTNRERGGRDRDQDRPQKFDTPRRFRGDLPRRERDQRARGNAPVIDDDITGDELGDELNTELRSLPTGLTITVAQHLVMTQRYLEVNPELALLHATHAKELAGRFPLVREIVGVAQYVNGNWQEALNDFRAVKRMAVADHLIPLMADCERGLGRPEKAIAFLAENRQLTGVDRIEAAIVEAGARCDLEQYQAALVALKIPALTGFPADQSMYARLCFAYASVLTRLNQVDEAQNWYRKADLADPAATNAAQFLTDPQDAIYLDDLDAEDDN